MKNQFVVTEKLFQSWGKESRKKGFYLAFKIVWCTLAAMIFLVCILYGWTFFSVFMLLFCLYRAFLHYYVITRAQYRRLSRTYGTSDWTRTIDFSEDGILVNDGKILVQYTYQDIVGFRENGNKIWLDASNKTVIRLYKDCFVDTDYESWKNWMKERGCV